MLMNLPDLNHMTLSDSIRIRRENKLSGLLIKNRRYAKLQELIMKGDFFSDENIQKRSPALYYHYVSKYEEPNFKYNKNPLLSDVLLGSYDRKMLEIKKSIEEKLWNENINGEMDMMEQDEANAIILETEDNHPNVDKICNDTSNKNENTNINDSVTSKQQILKNTTSLSEGDVKATMKNELLDIMYQRFLNGEETNEFVDFSQIDNDESLDNYFLKQQDLEDQYFSDE